MLCTFRQRTHMTCCVVCSSKEVYDIDRRCDLRTCDTITKCCSWFLTVDPTLFFTNSFASGTFVTSRKSLARRAGCSSAIYPFSLSVSLPVISGGEEVVESEVRSQK